MDDQGKPNPGKDRWDKIDILLKPMGGLFTGLMLAVVGYFTTSIIEQQQAEETNRRLYAEIMSSREKADTDLRKEMFTTIVDKFFDPSKEQIDEKIVAVELLAYNFHDVIDLSPLFKHVNSLIIGDSEEAEDRRYRLERVAREVIEKQLSVLSDKGYSFNMVVDFDAIEGLEGIESDTEFRERHIVQIYADEPPGPDNPADRAIALEVMDVHRSNREITVRLEIGDKDRPNTPEIDVHFRVGFFDFPMIDNTRISLNQRVAVALTRWSHQGADLSLIYFPGSRASLKEKPYYDEVIEQLRKTQAFMTED